MPSADLPFPLFRRGKVRDVYDLGDELLIVATDRISAFDVIMSNPVPGKGALLTGISNRWFDLTEDIIPNHRSSKTVFNLGLPNDVATEIAGRAVVARKAERIDIECVMRGYLAGSGWKEYAQVGTLAGEPLLAGLLRGSELPEAQFTPAIKNDEGHDENISIARMQSLIGEEQAMLLEATSKALYAFASKFARKRNLILADTKFEFGMIGGQLHVIDEVFTPDSSRYWEITSWKPGVEPASFDKQPVRDWLEQTGWDKQPPGPELPDAVVAATVDRYQALADRLFAD